MRYMHVRLVEVLLHATVLEKAMNPKVKVYY
jgi:hypothetical protein